MAGYCHGPNSPYGCGHHVQHQEAARKGWATRRRNQKTGVRTVRQELREEGAMFLSREEHESASAFLGSRIRNAHTHPSHKGRVLFQSGGKWYELPKRTFNAYVRGGRGLEQEQREREQQRKRQQNQAAARDLRYQLAQERMSNAYTRQQRADVVKFLQHHISGIRPDKKQGRYRGNREEWLSLPSQLRNTKSHYTMDQAAELVKEGFPELQIEDSNDLIRFFEKNEYQRQQSTSRRRSLQQALAGVVTPRTPRKRKAS